ncbi:MAG: class I SAM-dependent methyltransferase [Anaerolineae bacterium]|nr:class I SAM-dependent methyltransferase [Anaerolineae bacterium]
MTVLKFFLRAARRYIVQPLVLLLAKLTAIGLMLIPGNPAHRIFDRRGFHLLRKHFYLPIPEIDDVERPFWNQQSSMIGIDMNDQMALDCLEHVIPPFMDEFRAQFPLQPTENSTQFHLINGNYMAVDAHVYYAFIRYYKPKHIIEIGAGNSTRLAAVACMRNEQETGCPTNLTVIEPFPPDVLAKGFAGLTQLLHVRVQDVNLNVFTALEAGDILFIDSSHVLRSGGDVQFEYLEILPRLSPGVLVHIHDISLPKPYPQVYWDTQLYWNEQFLLQAFLTFNHEFQVVWPGSYMLLRYPDLMNRRFPELKAMRQSFPFSAPSAFWIRRL